MWGTTIGGTAPKFPLNLPPKPGLNPPPNPGLKPPPNPGFEPPNPFPNPLPPKPFPNPLFPKPLLNPPPKPLPLPALTNAEKRVLLELCRPWFAAPEDRKSFTVPTSVADIAAALVVGKGAVQQHLEHLYDKFGIRPDQSGDRRVRLANEVIE